MKTLFALMLAPGLAALPLSGQSWIMQAPVTSAEFRGLHAVDAKVVWAVGRGGVVVLTTDGGATWQADSIPGAANLFLVAVRALDARNAWVLGTAFGGAPLARIYQTGDGGRTWQQRYEAAAAGVFFDGMARWDARHGLAFGDPIGGRFVMVSTDDGGAHWTDAVSAGLLPVLPGEAAFAASGTAIGTHGGREVWMVTGGGAHARVFHSADRGASWTVADTPVSGAAAKGLFGIAFQDGRRGVAVGGDYQKRDESTDNLLLTTDGGRTWTAAASPGLKGVQYGVAYAGNGGFVSTGPGGSAWSKDRGNSWIRLDGPGFNTVSCAARVCWAAGVEGRIGRLPR